MLGRTPVDKASGLFKGAEPGQPPRFRYRDLYYITHIGNIPSILKHGILSHNQIQEQGIKDYIHIYNDDVVLRRKSKLTSDGLSLWNYTNLYLQPRNAMLYVVEKTIGLENIAILSCYVDDAKENSGALITDGNAASDPTNFFPISEMDRVRGNELKDVDGLEYWNGQDGTRRKMMAEVLIPNKYASSKIHSILVPNQMVKDKVEKLIGKNLNDIKIIIEPFTFFQSDVISELKRNFTLVKGDMFFSGYHTLTVSVNTKGVMGKGLASRAKYQFPDVYVKYQDACKNKSLTLGHPVLYKREISLDLQLADDPAMFPNPNNFTWFLLFATKDDWKNPASKDGIIKGLKWLIENYKSEGIKSLAIPALGCGLGWLEWKEIGPILCQYLYKLDIPVQLYIPAERPIPPEQLTKEFLLGSGYSKNNNKN